MDGGNLFGELAGLAAALVPGTALTPAAILRTAAERMTGRRLTVRVDGHDVRFTVTALDYEADTLRLAAGRLGDVRLVADDVTWPDFPLRRVTVLGKDVRVRSLPVITATPASVELEVRVAAEVVTGRLAELRPDLVIELADGYARVRWAKVPGLGHLDVEPTLAEDAVVLVPRGLRVAGLRLPPRIDAISVALPEFPEGLRLTGIEPHPDELVLRLNAAQWPERLSRVPLLDLLGWVLRPSG
ncbi:LmeA family phospholipid-binding protein [Amycolatopsis magusensis]|uniref:LmeA family phospholipid-binding protein n=1 Tax=Amycolatopsis magusensis TaxID=882444 RepID=UPI003C2FB06D